MGRSASQKIDSKQHLFEFDASIRTNSNIKLLAGVDECGRGAWAGPLCAGAVIFPSDIQPFFLDDSKKLTIEQRNEAEQAIKTNAIGWGIGCIHADQIDKHGINWANKEAMKQAIAQVETQCGPIDLLIVDQSPFKHVKMMMMSKADSISASVAAASIIAKVYHDNYMQKLHKQYPLYGFDLHKGYGNHIHNDALKKHGAIESIHRRTFKIDALKTHRQISLDDLI